MRLLNYRCEGCILGSLRSRIATSRYELSGSNTEHSFRAPEGRGLFRPTNGTLIVKFDMTGKLSMRWLRQAQVPSRR
jgi:hypothetical protein